MEAERDAMIDANCRLVIQDSMNVAAQRDDTYIGIYEGSNATIALAVTIEQNSNYVSMFSVAVSDREDLEWVFRLHDLISDREASGWCAVYMSESRKTVILNRKNCRKDQIRRPRELIAYMYECVFTYAQAKELEEGLVEQFDHAMMYLRRIREDMEYADVFLKYFDVARPELDSVLYEECERLEPEKGGSKEKEDCGAVSPGKQE